MDKRIDRGITIGRERGFIRAGNYDPSSKFSITNKLVDPKEHVLARVCVAWMP